jgi:hypothetical protein
VYVARVIIRNPVGLRCSVQKLCVPIEWKHPHQENLAMSITTKTTMARRREKREQENRQPSALRQMGVR